jgi:hypothetical protein
VCEQCNAKLEATFESRVRLIGGALLLDVSFGGLAQSLGADTWLALAAGAVALGAWFALRTESTLVLQPDQAAVLCIK